MPNPLWD